MDLYNLMMPDGSTMTLYADSAFEVIMAHPDAIAVWKNGCIDA